MWREGNLYGILFSPLLTYALVAFVLTLLLRFLFLRFGLYRWVWNPTLAEAAAYLCILGLLIGFL